jgi:hypothetical protein
MCLDMVPDYVKAVTTSADLETIIYMEDGGLAVTLKKRESTSSLTANCFKARCLAIARDPRPCRVRLADVTLEITSARGRMMC